jgi:hypothetical protein
MELLERVSEEYQHAASRSEGRNPKLKSVYPQTQGGGKRSKAAAGDFIPRAHNQITELIDPVAVDMRSDTVTYRAYPGNMHQCSDLCSLTNRADPGKIRARVNT